MHIFLTILFALILIAPAQADDPADYTAEITKAEDYLNNLSTGQARFVQTAHDGTQLVGTFYLKRPGKLRFEYDPPIQDFVVADGIFIYFYDSELKEQTNAPIGQTLADFFLRPNVKLSGDITVSDVQRGGNLLQIKLVQSDDVNSGSITLGFTEKPEMQLKKWRIVDGQGLLTEIELFYFKSDIEHPRGLFAYIDPEHGKSSTNFNE